MRDGFDFQVEGISQAKNYPSFDRDDKLCVRWLDTLTNEQILKRLEKTELTIDNSRLRLESGQVHFWPRDGFYLHEVVWAFQNARTELIRLRAKAVLFAAEELRALVRAYEEKQASQEKELSAQYGLRSKARNRR